MLITHATTTEKSLKHLYPGLLVPSNPTNATVNAYVVLRLYLSDGKDNKKELKKNIRFAIAADTPDYEFHYESKSVERHSVDGFVIVRCRSYPQAKSCRCYSTILVPFATMAQIEDFAFTYVSVQLNNGTHFCSYFRYHVSNRFSHRSDENRCLDDALYISDRQKYVRTMLYLRDRANIEKEL